MATRPSRPDVQTFAGRGQRLSALRRASGVSLVRYIFTWQDGFPSALDRAQRALDSGASVKLVMLSSQAYPAQPDILTIVERRLPLLVVGDEFSTFTQKSTPTRALESALQKAEEQQSAGFGDGWDRKPAREKSVPLESIRELDKDEKLEFLQAMYGSKRDDGTR